MHGYADEKFQEQKILFQHYLWLTLAFYTFHFITNIESYEWKMCNLAPDINLSDLQADWLKRYDFVSTIPPALGLGVRFPFPSDFDRHPVMIRILFMLLEQYVSPYILIEPGLIPVESYINCLSFDETSLNDKSQRKRN